MSIKRQLRKRGVHILQGDGEQWAMWPHVEGGWRRLAMRRIIASYRLNDNPTESVVEIREYGNAFEVFVQHNLAGWCLRHAPTLARAHEIAQDALNLYMPDGWEWPKENEE